MQKRLFIQRSVVLFFSSILQPNYFILCAMDNFLTVFHDFLEKVKIADSHFRNWKTDSVEAVFERNISNTCFTVTEIDNTQLTH